MLGRTNYNGPVRLDAANTQQVPAWARFDVGGHHTFDSTGDGNPGTVRANVIKRRCGGANWHLLQLGNLQRPSGNRGLRQEHGKVHLPVACDHFGRDFVARR